MAAIGKCSTEGQIGSEVWQERERERDWWWLHATIELEMEVYFTYDDICFHSFIY
jgi:hypothetical protein